MAIVYQHRRGDTNEVFYIGIGKAESRAYSKHGRSKPWKDLTKRHAYSVEIVLEELTWIEAGEKEKELIRFYGRRDLGLGILVNMADGGNGVENPSEEARKKNGDAHRGKPSWNKGLTKSTDNRVAEYAKKLTGRERSREHCDNLKKAHNNPELKEKKRQAMLGDKNPAKRSEVREQNRIAHLGNKNRVGKKHSNETKARQSKARIGKYEGGDNPRATPVKQIDKKTKQTLNVFSCATEASIATGTDNANIGGACAGRLKTAGGYIWENITKEEYKKHMLLNNE